ncbi:hypothetical protein G7Y89_g15017 [Cudoniella acicularis]|uniref:Uncharacterized protein n=1 Tax=Cudoniella acicularis TaxID=354080 RepID=A0A8H4QW44_9HELO|nr:hypothetical protein G7Y89_g15017 [Cudoniella acicularis]
MDDTFKPLGAGSLASREAERKLFIRARITCAEDLEEDSTRSWHIRPDFINGAGSRGLFYFMLLGEEAKTKHPTGLLLEEAGGGQFRRAGRIYACYTD